MINVRKRSSSTIPFGFELHPTNDHLLIENEMEQEALEYARKLKDTQSLRIIGQMLYARTGKNITPRGIQKILNRTY